MDDDMSYEMADEYRNDNNHKKKHTFLIVFVTFLIGLILGGASTGYFLIKVYNPFEKKEKVVKKVKTEEKEEKLDVDSFLVQNLINRLHDDTDFLQEAKLYASKTVDADVLEKDYVNTLMVNEATRESIGTNKDLTSENLDKALKTIFGNNTSFVVPEDDFGECPKYTYNQEDGVFIKNSAQCKNDTTKTIERTITKAILTKDKLEITEAVAFFDNEDKKVYTTVDANGKLSEEVEDFNTDSFLIQRDENKVKKYNYTFIYDEDSENYIFESISLVK